MTYLENKKILFSLIDEYAPDKQYFTDDEDARIKCANLYSPNYIELAGFRTRKKVKEFQVEEGTEVGYITIKLPRARLINQIMAVDKLGNPVSFTFKRLGEDIRVKNDKSYTILVEYTPFLGIISEDTDDDFELEIDEDLQGLLPYAVASDLFKTDPGENYQAFEKEYQRRLQLINTSNFGISANVTEGEF